MTSEVAILNKTGVALATDSAVTISQGGEVRKIYADANKLFELIKGVPVGIMIYDGAEIDGFPWETIIKTFRNNRPKSRDTLGEYVEDFLTYVRDFLCKREDESDQVKRLHYYVSLIIDVLVEDAVVQAEAISGKLERRKYFGEMIRGTLEQLRTVPPEAWAEKIDQSKLWRMHRESLTTLAPDSFMRASLTGRIRRELAETAFLYLFRSTSVPGPGTGLVIAGYGEDDAFPRLEHRRIGGLVEGQLMVVDSRSHPVTHDLQGGIIMPFAQTAEATMFLQGINPDISSAISTFWSTWAGVLHKNASQLAKSTFGAADMHSLHDFEKSLREYVTKSWDIFADFMNEEFHQKRLGPIEASAGFLSKREIADLAENLVDLTSLRDRVSLDRKETVGGATDVAVISKGDGFVWIKRKHYFSLDKNPTWSMRQVANGVTANSQSSAATDGGVSSA